MKWYNQPLTGFDGSNNPLWGPPQVIAQSPAISASTFDFAPYNTGTVQTAGVTTTGVLPSLDSRKPYYAYNSDAVTHTGYHLAGIDVASGAWLWGTAPSTLATYQGPWPTDGAFDIGNGAVGTSSKVTVVGNNIFFQFFGEGWKGAASGETNEWWHYNEDGLMVGQFGTTNIAGDEGLAGMAGNAASNTVVMGPNGSLYVYHCDESFHGGLHRWRIDNIDTINEQLTNVNWDQANYTPPVVDPTDMLAGLPFNSVVADGTAGWNRTPTADNTSDTALSWWHVVTDVTNYRKDVSPDIDISFANRPAATATVTRNLTDSVSPVSSWTLSTTLIFGWPNLQVEGLRIEILDTSGKVIAVVDPNCSDSACGSFNFFVNGQSVFQSPDQWSFLGAIDLLTPLTIDASAGGITFTYGSYARVTTSVSDSASNWQLPKTLRVYAWSTYGGYHYSVNLHTLHFVTKP